jgi:hypothetical protein
VGAPDVVPTTSVPPCSTPADGAAGRFGDIDPTSVSACDGGKDSWWELELGLGNFISISQQVLEIIAYIGFYLVHPERAPDWPACGARRGSRAAWAADRWPAPTPDVSVAVSIRDEQQA